ncbi:CapA family protein [Chitinispirillales bacterium ANBcel5]|uniref:CapA family protein n=1 Tax=Cellulosispirillum alkaliphilum TaxID=3039283 RepID=UPI002A531527|nr:CapA family protein [Chitinispirillales bacterium ANBcel5]
MLLNILLLIILFLFLFSVAYTYYPFKKPWLTESDYSRRNSPWWELYYASKYLNPVRRAANTYVRDIFSKTVATDNKNERLTESRKIVLKTVGDLMCRRDLIGKGGEGLWAHTGSFVFDCDYSIANLEFAVNPDNVIEKLLRFSVTADHAKPLLGDTRYGFFDHVSIANNHINDSFSRGILSTCNYLDEMKISMIPVLFMRR